MTLKSNKLESSVKQFLLLTVIIPIIILPLSAVLFYQLSIEVFPGNDFIFTPVSDSEIGGNSTAHGTVTDDQQYQFEYSIGRGIQYPYAQLSIQPNTQEFIDFSGYDLIRIKISTEKTESIILAGYFFWEGYSSLNQFNTLVPYQYVLPIQPDKKEYTVPLQHFHPPHWWFLNQRTTAGDLPADLTQKGLFLSLMINTSGSYSGKETIYIQNISLEKDNTGFYVGVILFVLLYYISVYIYLKFKKLSDLSRNEEIKVITYRGLKIDRQNSDIDKIEKFLGSNYSNSQMSLTWTAEELGYSSQKISELIKKNFQVTFPNYLNQVRMTEAKILLSTTDKPILEIAMLVGYNSVGHFNRIFKSAEGMTPRDYRKKLNEPSEA